VRQAGLLGRAEVHAAAVLGAHVVALAVELGRVVHQEENLQDLAGADLRRVIHQLDHLGAAGGAGAHLLVGGRGGLAVAVAAFHVQHAAHLLEHRLGAPEAAAGQHDGFA
jgi:hypothetical protein